MMTAGAPMKGAPLADRFMKNPKPSCPPCLGEALRRVTLLRYELLVSPESTKRENSGSVELIIYYVPKALPPPMWHPSP